MQQLTENGNITWSTLYNQHLDMINEVLLDLLGQSLDNKEEFNDEESKDKQLLKDEKEEEYRYDWMHLTEMELRMFLHCTSNLGSHDIDQNHDWINNAQ